MASILDLQQYSENKRAREMANNPLQQLVSGFDLGIKADMARREEQRKLQQEQNQAIQLYQQKAQIDAEVAAREADLKQNRVAQENERQNKIFEQLQSMDDRTVSGDVKRVIEGGKGTEIQRKVSPIKTSAKRVIKDGIVSTEITQEFGGDNNKEQMQEDKQLFDMAGKLRDDFRKSQVFKDFQEVRRAGTNITSAYNRSISADAKDRLASDQALVISFNKMLDPGSVVRESEYARTPEGQAAIQNFLGRATQLFKGGVGLTDQGRQEIKMMADELLKNAGSSAQKEADIYGNMADRFNIPRDMIFSDEEFKFDSLPLHDRSVGNGSVDVRIDSVNVPSISTIGRFQVEVQ
jgi:hypothetical protein